MVNDPEVVVVGGGVAGSALAIVLARAGIAVTIVEKSTVHVDRVRGEWVSPWGLAEVERLGLYDTLLAAGGHHVRRHVPYGEGVSIDEAYAEQMDLVALAGGLQMKSPLCMRHPHMCDVLNAEAAAAGVQLLRGVGDVTLTPGGNPEVSFHHGGLAHAIRPRIVVGADGRNSIVRRQAGVELHEDPEHHLMCGMLVDNIDGWPADLETLGTENDINFLVFPQSSSRARLYICYGSDQKRRFAGPGAQQRFLEVFRLKSVEASECLAAGQPAGPCNSYPNNDSWTDTPVASGVVLVGDAAGYNDPIIGQGLSIAYRDVRLVRDVMLSTRDWSPPSFAPYVAERRERMRRLRFSASFFSVIYAEFGPDALGRRLKLRDRWLADPSIGMARITPFIGPDMVVAEAFTQRELDRAFGA